MFAPYNEEITKLQRQIKGYKGQIKKLEGQLGSKDSKQVESGADSSDSGESKAAQAAEIHAAHVWERKCTTCGGDNENFKAPPNVFCHGPKCNGKIPVGVVDLAEVSKRTRSADGQIDITDLVKPCTNCGTHDFEVIEPGAVE